MLINYNSRCVCRKRHSSRRHFIHHNAERIKVAAEIYLFALSLFGAEIKYRADCLVSHSQRFGFRYFCDAEIRNLDKASLKKHNVLWLYVPVNNAFHMSVTQGGEDLLRESNCLLPGENALVLHIFAQGDSFEKFHNDIFVFAANGYIVNLDYIFVIEHCNGF